MLGRGEGGRVALGGAGARGLGLIMLGILLLIRFIVILKEDCVREIWT